MNYLAENSLPIWVVGAIAFTMAAVVYAHKRTLGALLSMVTVVGVTALLLLAERAIETPRESVERTLYELKDAVKANDIPSALSYVAPGASQIRKDIQDLMPLVIIERANILDQPRIEIDETTQPPTATVECRAFVFGRFKQNGMKGGDDRKVTVEFVREGDRWLVRDYAPDEDWRSGLPSGTAPRSRR